MTTTPYRMSLLLTLAATAACGSSGSSPEDAFTPTGCVSDSDCSDDRFCNGEESCDPTSEFANRFGCVTGEAPCDGRECFEAEATCAPECPDADGDGFQDIECGGVDCDDSDANRYPGNTEVCDDAGHDEDCDGTTFGERDVDADRFIDQACCNSVGGTEVCGLDCDDAVQGVNPVVPEVCNGYDDDCDLDIDEGCGCTEPGATRSCGMDGPGECRAGEQTCESGTWTACTGVLATEEEYRCDNLDENCNGEVDEGLRIICIPDVDRDGYGDATSDDRRDVCSDAAALAAPRFGCPAGFTPADRPADCCDTDADARPRTLGAGDWFAEPTSCGDYDYDCDGAERQRLTANGNPACGVNVGGACYCASSCNRGWQFGAPPACGETARACDGCEGDSSGCGSNCFDLVQECR
ncbi:MAG: putative metal-binding motif-containing protein [Deltaproteobacteria bacterium]|nr:putative metal-binding motif-containing protein [Deltaproteobacteria bacterium]